VSPSALDRLEEVTASDRAAWRRWLADHHATSPGVWLILAKKGSVTPSVTLEEAGLEALCFGWIDSKRMPLDSHRYRQSYMPRRPRSTWSKVNKERVERLIRDGSMTPAGLAAIETAKANGSWASLDAVEALSIPDDLADAFAADPIARSTFDAYPPSVKKLSLHRLNTAKRAETRSRRIDEIVGQANEAGRSTRSD